MKGQFFLFVAVVVPEEKESRIRLEKGKSWALACLVFVVTQGTSFIRPVYLDQ